MSNKDFQKRFKNQIQTIGKSGIMGTMDSNHYNINNNQNAAIDYFSNNNYIDYNNYNSFNNNYNQISNQYTNKFNANNTPQLTLNRRITPEPDNPVINSEMNILPRKRLSSNIKNKISTAPLSNSINNSSTSIKKGIRKRIKNTGENIINSNKKELTNKNFNNNKSLKQLEGYPLKINQIIRVPSKSISNSPMSNYYDGSFNLNSQRIPVYQMMPPITEQIDNYNKYNSNKINQNKGQAKGGNSKRKELIDPLVYAGKNDSYPLYPKPKLDIYKNDYRNSNSNDLIKSQLDPLTYAGKNDSYPLNPKPKLNIVTDNNKSYQFFKPYTLNDYREFSRSPVVMGSLGPNTGTKEWEEKKNLRNKMSNYCNRLNQVHKGITSFKKDSPTEEMEKQIKTNFENSNRFRTYEYGKLVRPFKINKKSEYEFEVDKGGVMNYFNKSEKKSVKGGMAVINENEEDEGVNHRNDWDGKEQNRDYIKVDFGGDNKEGKDTNGFYGNNYMNIKDNEIDYVNMYNNSRYNNEGNNNINTLLRQNEEYEAKIKDIKNSLI